jgi:hypothetical protein
VPETLESPQSAAYRVFSVGDDVVLLGHHEIRGRVVEDRGPLGPNGTQIIRIVVHERNVDEPVLFEVPANLVAPAKS